MADEIKVKMSEFAQATQINNEDDIIILQNGENKKVKSPVLESKIMTRTVEELSKDGGVSLNLVNLKGVVATYANLPTTNLQINDAYQVTADGLVYVWNGTAFQANGQGFKIQPDVNGVVEQGNREAVSGGEVFKAVKDAEKLKNQDFAIIGKNKFDKTERTDGVRLSATNTVIVDTTRFATGFMACKPLTNYALSTTPQAILFFDSNKVFLSSINSTRYFVTPENTYYVRTSAPLTSINTLQFEEGTETTTYEPFKVTINNDVVSKGSSENYGIFKIDGNTIVKNSSDQLATYPYVTTDRTNFFETGKNKFNKNTIKSGFRLTSVGVEVEDSVRGISDYIVVKPNTTYIASGTGQVACFYDKNYKLISGLSASETFTTPSNAYYVRRNASLNQLNSLQIEEGTVTTLYEVYELKLKSEYIKQTNSLPDFAINEIKLKRVAVANLNRNRAFLNFGFVTDSHIGLEGNTLLSEQTFVEMCNEGLVDFASHGGDLFDCYGTDFDTAVERTRIGQEVLHKLNVPLFQCVGNHDKNIKLDPIYEFTNQFLYALYKPTNTANIVFDEAEDLRSTYYYIDYPQYKIRVFITNTHHKDGAESNNLGENEVEFLQTKVLDFTNKSNWGLVVIGHMFSGEGITITNFKQSLVDFNTTRVNNNKVIGCFAGHVHNDSNNTDLGFQIITCDTSINTPAQRGSINEICFNIITIDTVANKIHITKVGRGDSRTLDIL